jgi:single-strand DNA-binding protein
MGMNVCIFEGTICGGGAAPKYYPTDGAKKSMIMFSIAVQGSRKDANGQYEADFISCKAFGPTADFVNSYFKEKDHIGVQAAYQLEKSQNQQTGQEQNWPKFIVNQAYFVGTKNGAGTNNNQQQQQMPAMPPQYGAQPQVAQPVPGQQQGYPAMPQVPAQFGQAPAQAPGQFPGHQQPAQYPGQQMPAQGYPNQQIYNPQAQNTGMPLPQIAQPGQATAFTMPF